MSNYDISSITYFFFFNDTATTEIYTLSLHDALPILSTQTQEQGQGNRTSNRQNTTTKQNHSNKEFMRAAKDSNVSITSQDSYELAQILKSRLLGNFEFTVIRLSDYYPLFDKLFLKLFGASVVPI